MAASAILNLLLVSILVNNLFPVAGFYIPTKFRNCISTGGWVIAFCGKIQNGGVRHFEFVFGNSGPPTKFTYGPEGVQQIWC